MLAPLAGYPVGRFLCATALGRFPRLWFFAALGTLPIPPRVLMGAVAAGMVVAVGLLLGRPIAAALRRAWSRGRRHPRAVEVGGR